MLLEALRNASPAALQQISYWARGPEPWEIIGRKAGKRLPWEIDK
jgi:hypothetical protein